MIVFQILFFLCLFLLLYTYALYPAFVRWLAENRKPIVEDSLAQPAPRIVVLLSAYNEEQIIEEKIDSVFNTDYPRDRLTMLIGSDSSSDNTDLLIRQKQKQYEGLFLRRMEDRSGKANVLNQLRKEAQGMGEIVVLTDANVLFRRETLKELARPFSDENVGQVAANIQNYQVTREEIGSEEEYYIGRENQTKYAEGLLWGCMMGAFGACYAIRAELMPEVPSNFLMEDFFISLHVLSGGHKALMSPKAVVMEDIPGSIRQEYQRKRRISAGNFQNLSYYRKLILDRFFPVGFVFLSHKILRWLGPFFLIIAALSLLVLAAQSSFYWSGLLLALGLLLFVFLDIWFQKMQWYVKPLRMMRYFLTMNLALLSGFFFYLQGVKSNAWQPTIRKT